MKKMLVVFFVMLVLLASAAVVSAEEPWTDVLLAEHSQYGTVIAKVINDGSRWKTVMDVSYYSHRWSMNLGQHVWPRQVIFPENDDKVIMLAERWLKPPILYYFSLKGKSSVRKWVFTSGFYGKIGLFAKSVIIDTVGVNSDDAHKIFIVDDYTLTEAQPVLIGSFSGISKVQFGWLQEIQSSLFVGFSVMTIDSTYRAQFYRVTDGKVDEVPVREKKLSFWDKVESFTILNDGRIVTRIATTNME